MTDDVVVDISQFRRPKPPEAKASIEKEAWDSCQHAHMRIDSKQRTVKCADCGMWLDPVWCLQELIYYYETRIDHRLEQIKDFEKRAQEQHERKESRKRNPRKSFVERRTEALERAAYNEYQAKVLQARADRQKMLAHKIDAQLNDPACVDMVAR